MLWKVLCICVVLFVNSFVAADYFAHASIPLKSSSNYSGDYYDSIDPKAPSDQLKAQLHELVSNHTALSYKELWTAFRKIDEGVDGCGNGLIRGLYSATCWKESQQCGNYKREGDCFNREHGWPKSWWGGFSKGHGAQTDLFHLYPVDGYVNGLRSALPLGDVTDPTYTSSNGCKVGSCASLSGQKCFEVEDEFKGDFARSYFYVSISYMGVFDCCDVAGVNRSTIKPWMEQTLRGWHKQDPVSDKEVARNGLIFEEFQHNRNPFIDHPEWVDLINDF
jgi:endonuclease I